MTNRQRTHAGPALKGPPPKTVAVSKQDVRLIAGTLLRRETSVHVKFHMVVQPQLLDTWAAV